VELFEAAQLYLLLSLANLFLNTAELGVATEIIDRSKMVKNKTKIYPVYAVKAYLRTLSVVKHL
jgi:hypothetical protein